MNIAVIDEVSGEVLKLKTFDTYSSSSSSTKLAQEIEDLPPGALVMLSASGNAASNLQTRAR